MRDYEVLYIVRPDLEDDKVQDAVKRVNSLITRSGGSTDQTSLWGKRKLAYEVKHQREGSYILQDFKIDPERVPELESALKITEEVLRHLIVRKPEKTARPTKTTTTTTTSAAPPPAEATREPATTGTRGAGAADGPDADREER